MDSDAIYVENSLFIGRIEEQNQFRAALEDAFNPPPNEDLPHIVLINGDGGMGKSTLTKRFRDMACSEPPFEGGVQTLWVDWEDERLRSSALQVGREHISPETVFDILHAAAIKQNWGRHFGTYQDMLKKRGEAEKKAVEALFAGGERDELSTLRGAGASVIAKILRAGLPIGETGEQFAKAFMEAGIQVGAERAAQLRANLEKRVRSRLDPKQYDFLLNPPEQLARALAEGLRKISTSSPLAIFLDTYEIVDRIDLQLREVMRAAGPRLVWVISGRNNLLENRVFDGLAFKGYANEFLRRLLVCDLHQLTRPEIRALFASRAPARLLNEEELQNLSAATHSVPLALDEAAEMWARGISLAEIVGESVEDISHQNIVQKMTERYLLHAVAPADRQVFYALALAGGDIEILRAMLRPAPNEPFDLDGLLRRMERDYASVHYQKARLHDDPAFFLREYLKNEIRRSDDGLRDMNQRATVTLRARLEKLQADLPLLEHRCEDEDWSKAALDLARYLFWLDESEAWHWWVPRLVESLAYSSDLRNGLLQIAAEWESYLSKSGQKRIKLLTILAGSPSLDEISGLLDELSRLEALGWLKGEAEDERGAILDWQRGLLLYGRQKFDQALLCFERAERALPEHGKLLAQQLGAAMQDLADQLIWPGGVPFAVYSADAQRILEKVLFWLPENETAWYRLGTVLERSEKPENAILAYKNALKLNPRDPYVYFGLGLVHADMGSSEEALQYYQRAVELDPGFAHAYYGMGNVYSDLGRLDEALQAYQHAIDQAPHFSHAYYELGLVYADQGELSEAQQAFQRTIELDPEFAGAYNSLGQVSIILGDLDAALLAFQRAVELDPGFAEAYHGLGQVYDVSDVPDKAMQAYRRAIELDPQAADPYVGLGDVYAGQGHLAEALQAYQRAVELEPGFSEAYFGLGWVFENSGVPDKAMQAYRRAIELDPQFADAYAELGNVHAGQGHLTEALQAYQRALELDAEFCSYHASAARILFQLGQAGEAQQHLQLAREQISQASEYQRACFEAICGNADEALALLEKAVQMMPGLVQAARYNPDFDALRQDTRFIDLTRGQS